MFAWIRRPSGDAKVTSSNVVDPSRHVRATLTSSGRLASYEKAEAGSTARAGRGAVVLTASIESNEETASMKERRMSVNLLFGRRTEHSRPQRPSIFGG